MAFSGSTWRLLRGDEPIGEIHVDDGDFPWLSGGFAPAPGFAAVRPWFEESRALLDAEDHEAFDRSYDRIADALTLVAPDGPVAEFLLHIDGGRASFRWSDEPFEEASEDASEGPAEDA
ncbi:hypothetical protein OH807_04250 [Kitasatospora sp. NBC_01560]|uniref:hypothetical protein n=1 Tax=Kitasatospora sp. NBC_01560 TaxID=2975965 RepID=UPI0038631932